MALKDWRRWLLFLGWLAVLLISLKAHTPWRDEYQSWLISTRAPDLQSFFDAIRYERHPPLLYVLQRTLVSVFPSVLEWPTQWAIELVTVPFTVGAAFLLIFALGLSPIESLLIVFGPYLLREFGVISRVYALGVFFLLAATALGQRKRLSPAFALLAIGSLTHLLFSWVCGAIFILLIAKDRRRWKNPSLWLSLSIFVGSLALQWPPVDGVFRSQPAWDPKIVLIALRGLNQSLWGLEKIWQPYQWNTLPMATELALIFFIPALWLIHRHLELRKFIWVCLPVTLLSAAGTGLNLRSLGVAFFGFLACSLLFPKQDRPTNLKPQAVFAFTAFFSSALWWLTWAPFSRAPHFDFSGARELDRAAILKDSSVLTEQDSLAFTWMAESKVNVFDVRRDRELAYPYFKKSEYHFEDAGAWCKQNLERFKSEHKDRPIHLILRADQSLPEACGSSDQVFVTARRVLTDEEFSVYVLK